MPRKRSNVDALGWTPQDKEEFNRAIRERPRYMCPICWRLDLNIKNEIYNRIELWGHLRLHKLDDLRDELVEAICGSKKPNTAGGR